MFGLVAALRDGLALALVPALAHEASRLPLAVSAASSNRKLRRLSSLLSSCSDTCGPPRNVTAEAHRGRAAAQCDRLVRGDRMNCNLRASGVALPPLPLSIGGELGAVLALEVHQAHRLHQARGGGGIGPRCVDHRCDLVPNGGRYAWRANALEQHRIRER